MYKDYYLRLAPEDQAALERVVESRGTNTTETVRQLIREAAASLTDAVRTTKESAEDVAFRKRWEKANPGKRWPG